jgi:hypothetical protein
MEKNSGKPVGLGLTVVGALARLVPHIPNFTPVGGMSLFAGARLRGWRAFMLPLALMAVTDPFVGGYSFATPFIYTALLINVWLGSRLLRNTQSPLRIGSVTALGSLQFFVITNFGVWLKFPETYAHTFQGLAACYIAAIPFYGRELAAGLFYSAALFGLHAWLSRRANAEQPAAQVA